VHEESGGPTNVKHADKKKVRNKKKKSRPKTRQGVNAGGIQKTENEGGGHEQSGKLNEKTSTYTESTDVQG